MCVPNAVKQQIQSLEGKFKRRLYPLGVWGIGAHLWKHLLCMFLDLVHVASGDFMWAILCLIFFWRMMCTLYNSTSAILLPKLSIFCVIVNWIFLQECWWRGWGAQTTWGGTPELSTSNVFLLKENSVLWHFLNSNIPPPLCRHSKLCESEIEGLC